MDLSLSRRGVELSHGCERHVVVRRTDVNAARGAEALDTQAGRWVLEDALAGGPVPSASLGQMYQRLLGGSLRTHDPEHLLRMREAVLDQVARGTLVVLRAAARRVIMRVERHEDVLGPEDDLRSWIEIELLDDSGAPVGEEPYEIVTGDGRLRTGTLDARGRAREEGIDPGDCKVTFPRLHEWRAA